MMLASSVGQSFPSPCVTQCCIAMIQSADQACRKAAKFSADAAAVTKFQCRDTGEKIMIASSCSAA